MAYPKTYNPCDDCPYSFSKNNEESNMCKYCEFKQLLDRLPTADVQVVRHGEWHLHPDGSGTCSLCGRTQKAVWDFDNAQEYCGKCGADMRGDKNDV